MSSRVCLALLLLTLFVPAYGQSADWTLTQAELTRLREGGVLVTADVSSDPSAGEVRAAVQIHASPEQVFRTLTDCTQALAFVPHLQHCAVLESSPDGSWQVVEHDVHYGWFIPDTQYVFRAEYDRYRRILISNVSGDLRYLQGDWEFHPVEDGTATIVTYRVRAVPRLLVSRWLIRSTLKRDLPQLMARLRSHSETPARIPAPSAAQSPGIVPTNP